MAKKFGKKNTTTLLLVAAAGLGIWYATKSGLFNFGGGDKKDKPRNDYEPVVNPGGGNSPQWTALGDKIIQAGAEIFTGADNSVPMAAWENQYLNQLNSTDSLIAATHLAQAAKFYGLSDASKLTEDQYGSWLSANGYRI